MKPIFLLNYRTHAMALYESMRFKNLFELYSFVDHKTKIDGGVRFYVKTERYE